MRREIKYLILILVIVIAGGALYFAADRFISRQSDQAFDQFLDGVPYAEEHDYKSASYDLAKGTFSARKVVIDFGPPYPATLYIEKIDARGIESGDDGVAFQSLALEGVRGETAAKDVIELERLGLVNARIQNAHFPDDAGQGAGERDDFWRAYEHVLRLTELQTIENLTIENLRADLGGVLDQMAQTLSEEEAEVLKDTGVSLSLADFKLDNMQNGAIAAITVQDYQIDLQAKEEVMSVSIGEEVLRDVDMTAARALMFGGDDENLNDNSVRSIIGFEELKDISVTSNADGKLTIASIIIENVGYRSKGRPLVDLVSDSTLAGGEDVAPEEAIRLASELLALYSNIILDRAVMSDLNGQFAEDGETVSIQLDELGVQNIDSGVVGSFYADGFAVESSEGAVGFARYELGGYDYGSFSYFLDQIAARPDDEIGPASALNMLFNFEFARLSDLMVRAGDSGTATLAVFEISDVERRQNLPVGLKVNIENFALDKSFIQDPNSAWLADALAGDALIADFTATYDWNPEQQIMSLRDTRLSIKELLSTELAVEFNGLRLPDPDQPGNTAWYENAALTDLLFAIDDATLIDLMIRHTAVQAGISDQDYRNALTMQIDAVMNAFEEPQTVLPLRNGLKKFVLDPRSLRLEANPEEPIDLATLNMYVTLAPTALAQVMNFDVWANGEKME